MSQTAPQPPPRSTRNETGDNLLEPAFMVKLEQLAVLSKKVFRGRMKGERRSKKKGISIEFADYKGYVPGDDLRFIDWNIFGRLDKLFLKLFMEEEDLFVHLLIDTSRSMDFGNPSKFLLAKKVAAALGYIGLAKLDRVALGAVAGGKSIAIPSTRGRRQMHKLVTFLNSLEPDGTTDLAESTRLYFMQNRARGVCILVSDFLDPAGYEPVLKQMLYHDLDAYVIHVLAEEEIEPTVSGDLELVDVETGETSEITVNQRMLETYRNNLNSFIGQIKRYTADRGIHYFFAPSTVHFEELVLDTLRRGGLVR